MPVTYKIDKAGKVLRTTTSGQVTVEEVIAYYRQLEHDPDCPDYLDVVLDLTAETSTPTPQFLRDVASEIARIRYRVRFGFCAVAVSRDVLFGMLRMLEVFTEEYFREFQVFRTVGEAEVWLESKRTKNSAAR